MQLCDYGCGKEAKYQIKKNKYCCSEYISQCPTIREKNSKGNLGKPCIKTYKPKLLNDEIKKICVYGCGQEAKYQFKNGKLCCNDNYSKCPAMIEKMKLARKGTPRKIVFKPIILSEDKKLICDYGCGQQAKYQFHNGKVCCSEKHHKCQHIREKNSKTKKTEKYNGTSFCDYGCGQQAKYQYKNNKLCCSPSFAKCPIMKQQNGEELKNKTFEERYGIEKAKEIKNSMSISLKGKTYIDLHGEEKAHFLSKQNSLSQKLSIDQIQKRYPTFAKEEEMRYNPETPIEEKEIQVHCKNAHCENSKEKGGWFTPTGNQLDGRRRALEDLNGNDGGYIYCSQYCKDTCPLYMSRGTDPYRDMIDNSLDSVEWNLIRQMRFKLDNNECQICGTKENLRCHHIQPVKTYSQLALDVDNCITLCNICHNKVHSGKDKDCSYGNLAKKKCKKQVSKI